MPKPSLTKPIAITINIDRRRRRVTIDTMIIVRRATTEVDTVIAITAAEIESGTEIEIGSDTIDTTDRDRANEAIEIEIDVHHAMIHDSRHRVETTTTTMEETTPITEEEEEEVILAVVAVVVAVVIQTIDKTRGITITINAVDFTKVVVVVIKVEEEETITIIPRMMDGEEDSTSSRETISVVDEVEAIFAVEINTTTIEARSPIINVEATLDRISTINHGVDPSTITTTINNTNRVDSYRITITTTTIIIIIVLILNTIDKDSDLE